jgi:hypothetical protein
MGSCWDWRFIGGILMATDMMGLLSQGNPLMDMGFGLLSQSGYSTTPVSMGQALGNAGQYMSQRDRARLENQAIRDQMKQQQQRQQAMSQIQGLLVPPTTPGPVVQPSGPAPIQTPEGRNQMMGLLGQVAPEAMAQGLLGQMFAQPESPRVSTELNTFKQLYPELQEGSEEFRNKYMDFTAQAQDPLQMLQVEKLIMDLQNARTEQEQKTAEAALGRTRATYSANSNLRALMEIADANDTMAQTFLETGAVGSEGRRSIASGISELRRLVGNEDPALDNAIRARDRFEQMTSQVVADMAEGSEGMGQLTNQKLALLASTKPSLQNQPAANALRIADMIEESLNAYMAEEIQIEPQLVQAAQQRIESLRSSYAPQRESVNLDQINQMTLDQIRNLPPEGLSDAALEAAAQRYRALGGQ